jgi:hypothetical protein
VAIRAKLVPPPNGTPLTDEHEAAIASVSARLEHMRDLQVLDMRDRAPLNQTVMEEIIEATIDLALLHREYRQGDNHAYIVSVPFKVNEKMILSLKCVYRHFGWKRFKAQPIVNERTEFTLSDAV